jgi:hypothetical protein
MSRHFGVSLSTVWKRASEIELLELLQGREVYDSDGSAIGDES